jgi:phospholipid transport system substrate-binding protein
MLRSTFLRYALAMLGALTVASGSHAQASGPDTLIRQVSAEVVDALKNDKAIQSGDVGRILEFVDAKVMPHVDFQRMTASAVGRPWRNATPEQKQRLQEEFKVLIVRTYAGALREVKPQTTVELKPFRGSAEDKEAVVRTLVKAGGEPIQLDYRLEKTDSGWKVYDMNVLGVWMVDQYRNMFAQEINAGGVDALISKLAERNKTAGKS